MKPLQFLNNLLPNSLIAKYPFNKHSNTSEKNVSGSCSLSFAVPLMKKTVNREVKILSHILYSTLCITVV